MICSLIAGPGSGDFVQANPNWSCGTTTLPGIATPVKMKGYQCPSDQGQYCSAAIGNPNYGFTGFDNLAQAALLMVQVAFWVDENSLYKRCCTNVSHQWCQLTDISHQIYYPSYSSSSLYKSRGPVLLEEFCPQWRIPPLALMTNFGTSISSLLTVC